jgi:hypothetical protein
LLYFYKGVILRSFKEIITILKVRIHLQNRKKVFDKDIAKLLEIAPSRFATLKKRDSTPFIEILEYCEREKICANQLFFG